MKRGWQDVNQEESEGEDVEDWSSAASNNLPGSPSSKNTYKELSKVQYPSVKSDHSRTIIHIDLDCFYAQVEMIRNPKLRSQPLGIQQKNIVVTCNYVARKFGVTKLMYISDAKERCPELVLVSGEDLSHYREYSEKVTDLLQTEFSSLVEKLGFDENFVDVTSLVEKTVEATGDESLVEVEGHTFGSDGQIDCTCGCNKRMVIGSQIAARMRERLREAIGITGCAGIAWNKLLAKLVGEKNKPNDQTTLLPGSAEKLMLSLGNVRRIPGIGHSMNKKLESLGIVAIGDLQTASSSDLGAAFGSQNATTMKNSSFGIDNTAVTRSGPPKSMSDEDSFKLCATLNDAKERMYNLLKSVLERLEKDGRTPQTIRLTIRKYSSTHKWLRESRQTQMPTFITEQINKGIYTLHGPLMDVLLVLFNKMVNVQKPFHLTLINVCLTNFQVKSTLSKSLEKYFSRTKCNEDEDKDELDLKGTYSRNNSTDDEPGLKGIYSRNDSTGDEPALIRTYGKKNSTDNSPLAKLFKMQARHPHQAEHKVLENTQSTLSFFKRKSTHEKVMLDNSQNQEEIKCYISQQERNQSVTMTDCPNATHFLESKSSKSITFQSEGDLKSKSDFSCTNSDEARSEEDYVPVGLGLDEAHSEEHSVPVASSSEPLSGVQSSICELSRIPENVDVTVFQSLPLDMREDLLREWNNTSSIVPQSKSKTASSQLSTSSRRITDFFTKSSPS